MPNSWFALHGLAPPPKFMVCAPFLRRTSGVIGGRHGGWKKEGGGKPHERDPSQEGVLDPPLVWYVFHPPQVSVLCFSCTKIHDRADNRSSFGGVQKFSGERVLWYVFLPPYVLHPPISRPNVDRR